MAGASCTLAGWLKHVSAACVRQYLWSVPAKLDLRRTRMYVLSNLLSEARSQVVE